jgi:hypothetical protein
MALITLDLDPDSLRRLTEIAVSERRPVGLQAEVLLLRALGRWPIPECHCPEGTDQLTPEAIACPRS